METQVINLAIKAAIEKQGDMTDRQMAKKLGVSSVMWGYLKSGARQPGMKTLKAIASEFPELQLIVFQSMTVKE